MYKKTESGIKVFETTERSCRDAAGLSQISISVDAKDRNLWIPEIEKTLKNSGWIPVPNDPRSFYKDMSQIRIYPAGRALLGYVWANKVQELTDLFSKKFQCLSVVNIRIHHNALLSMTEDQAVEYINQCKDILVAMYTTDDRFNDDIEKKLFSTTNVFAYGAKAYKENELNYSQSFWFQNEAAKVIRNALNLDEPGLSL